jgi:hypothetical protein
MGFTCGFLEEREMRDAKELMRRANELFNCGIWHIDRHNRKAWVRSVLFLGDKWILAKPVSRITGGQP